MIFKYWTNFVTFLKEAKVELKKVQWPNFHQTAKYTAIVVGVSFAVAFFLGAIDYLLLYLMEKIV